LDWSSRSPFDELERMRRQMDWLSDSLQSRWFTEPSAGVFPLVNVTEDKDTFFVRAELPGIKPDELDISVTGNNLSISGERKMPAEDADATYHRREREEGRFSRMISLPTPIDAGKVEAHWADGVLTIVLPKAETAKPKQIAVKTS
jgi:HSP20 family protein